MKKITTLLCLLGLFLSYNQLKAQAPTLVVSPQVQCYNAGGNTSNAYLSPSIPGAASYSWAVASSSGSCAASATTFSNGMFATINYPCCGAFTVTVFAFSPNNALIGSYTQTAIVACNSSLPVQIAPASPICPGASATLTAFGATSYTWSNGATTQNIVVSPSVTTCYTVAGFSSIGCLLTGVKCVTVSSGGPVVVSSSSSTICAGQTVTLTASGSSTYTWTTGMGVFTGAAIVLSPSVTTCYTVVGSNGPGCGGSASGCVNVTPGGGIGITGVLSICPGQSTTLYATGGFSLTWQPGGSHSSSIIVSPSSSTCYTLTGIGCAGFTGAVSCVTVGSPVISVYGNTSLCAGQSTTLTATGAQSYTWMVGSVTYTGSSVVITPSTTTCYTVVGSNSPPCIGYASGCVNVTPGGAIGITGVLGICAGQSTTLSATGGYSLTWQPGGLHSTSIVVSPSVTTCYTLTGYGCNGLTSAVRCVSVNAGTPISISTSTACGGATVTASGASSYTWYTTQGTYTGSTIVLTPTVPATPTTLACYNLIANNGACSSTTNACIVIPSGGNPVISGNLNICGGSTTLFASGASSYTWLPSGATGSSITVTPSVTTCYTLVGYSCNNSLVSTVRCVTVSSASFISVSGPTTICAGQSATLTVSGASTYTWVSVNGTFTGSTIVVTPSASICYTITGSNGTGCNSLRFFCLNVNPGTVGISGNTNVCAGQSTILYATGGSSLTWQPGGSHSSSIVVSPSVSTCYTLTGLGCSGFGSAVACVNISPGSSITVGGNNSICGGSTATLYANGASSYTWLPGNILGSIIAITPTISTCYTVVGTSSTGCVSLGYKCLQITPVPVITTSGGFFCAGNPGVLTASGASTYTWLPYGLTGSSITITPSVSSCYTVIGSNGLGCTGTAVGCFSVMPSPVITVTGNSVICAGSSVNLVATGASNYNWQPGNLSGASVIVSPSLSTCYTVTANSGNCISRVVKCITVQNGGNLNISGANIICAGAGANLLASGASTYTWNTGSNSPFITVNPLVSTCYTVIGTTSGGCIGTAVKCLSVQANPVVTVGGPGSICAGSNAMLVASGAASYVWSTGATSSSIFVNPLVSTTYSVSGSNGNCTGSAVITVTVRPRPNVNVMRSDSMICAGESVNLTASGATTYTWSNGATSSNIIVTPLVSTSYTVVGSNTFGCTNGNVISVFVSPCTGITQNSETIQIGMYPNPTKGLITLQGDDVNAVTYTVFDITGRELVKGKFTSSKNVDLSTYANGTYIVRFETGSAASYKKIVLDK